MLNHKTTQHLLKVIVTNYQHSAKNTTLLGAEPNMATQLPVLMHIHITNITSNDIPHQKTIAAWRLR